jgi:hypothetical protein
VSDLYDRVASLQVDTLVLTGLRFSFKVERTLRPRPGKAEVRVWNLTSSHRDQLDSLDGVPVVLDAGYAATGTATLFSGTLRRVSHERVDGNTWITKVEGEDGGRQRRIARTARSFRPGTPLRTIFAALATDFGVGQGNTSQATANAALEVLGSSTVRGVPIAGRVEAELDRICAAAGLEWSIQNGALQILPVGASLSGQAVILSPSSGLVGSPTKEQRGRVKFRSLINPAIVPGKQVQIQSRVVTGAFRVDRCTWSGDTEGQDWYVDGEAA